IVMPVTTPFAKVTNTEVLGASIVQHGDTVDEAQAFARRLADEQGLTWVAPFDDPLVVAGQGTVALEMCEDAPPFDDVVVPVGGGGLSSGMALVIDVVSPGTRVTGVQAERFCAMVHALSSHRDALRSEAPLRAPTLGPFGADTLADGIAVKSPGALTKRVI